MTADTLNALFQLCIIVAIVVAILSRFGGTNLKLELKREFDTLCSV